LGNTRRSSKSRSTHELATRRGSRVRTNGQVCTCRDGGDDEEYRRLDQTEDSRRKHLSHVSCLDSAHHSLYEQNNFDDVERRRAVDPNAFLPSRYLELQDSQSQKSLAEIYAEDYEKSREKESGRKVTNELDKDLEKKHAEIEELFEELAGKLDALSNARFTPKAVRVPLTLLDYCTLLTNRPSKSAQSIDRNRFESPVNLDGIRSSHYELGFYSPRTGRSLHCGEATHRIGQIYSYSRSKEDTATEGTNREEIGSRQGRQDQGCQTQKARYQGREGEGEGTARWNKGSHGHWKGRKGGERFEETETRRRRWKHGEPYECRTQAVDWACLFFFRSRSLLLHFALHFSSLSSFSGRLIFLLRSGDEASVCPSRAKWTVVRVTQEGVLYRWWQKM